MPRDGPVLPGTPRWRELVRDGITRDAARNWFLGDAALEIAPMGEDQAHNGSMENLRRYASEVGVAAESLRVYRTVSRSWPPEQRVPDAAWSAHRTLMGAGLRHLIRPGMKAAEATAAVELHVAQRMAEALAEFREAEAAGRSRPPPPPRRSEPEPEPPPEPPPVPPAEPGSGFRWRFSDVPGGPPPDRGPPRVREREAEQEREKEARGKIRAAVSRVIRNIDYLNYEGEESPVGKDLLYLKQVIDQIEVGDLRRLGEALHVVRANAAHWQESFPRLPPPATGEVVARARGIPETGGDQPPAA